MRALILAGGKGTRLRSMVSDVPKPLAHVRGKPFLEHLMDYWLDQGVNEFTLSVGHLAHKVKEHFSDTYKGAMLQIVEEPKALGTGGGIVYAIKHLKDPTEDLLIMNGDSFVGFELCEFKDFHLRKKSSITIALREVSKNDRYSAVILDSKQKIKAFNADQEPQERRLINAGVYLTNPLWLLEKTKTYPEVFSIENDFFQKIVFEESAYGFLCDSKFIDIGIPRDYEKAQTFFADV